MLSCAPSLGTLRRHAIAIAAETSKSTIEIRYESCDRKIAVLSNSLKTAYTTAYIQKLTKTKNYL